MNITTLIREFFRFLRDNGLRISLGALGLALLFAGGRYYLSQHRPAEEEAAYAYLLPRYSQKPAEFQGVVTTAQGEVFHNSYIFDEYFSQEDVVATIEADTGIQFGDWLDHEEALGLNKTSQYRGALAAIRNTSTGVITFRFSLAETPEENLRIAQAYQDLFLSEEIPFMEDQKASLMTPAQVGELLDLERNNPGVATPEILSIYYSAGWKDLALYGGIGLILGAFLALGILLVRQACQARIQYAFEYGWDIQDGHLLLDRQQVSGDGLLAWIQQTGQGPGIILVQGGLFQSQTASEFDLDNPSVAINSLTQLRKDQEPEEIVFIIYSNHSLKAWYQKEYALASYYGKPIRIVHLI